MFQRLTPLEPVGTGNYQASKKYKIMGQDLEKQDRIFCWRETDFLSNLFVIVLKGLPNLV